MPTSRSRRKHKPSAPVKKTKVTADDLLDKLSMAAADADLETYDALVRKLKVAALTDTTLDRALFEDLAAMRDIVKSNLETDEDIDAALWAGDMDRVFDLEDSRGQLDPEALDLAGQDDGDDREDLPYLPPLDPYAGLVQGLPDAVDALLAAGVDLNEPGGVEQRAALFAALEGPGRNADTLQRLIDAGANPRAVNEYDESLLAWSISFDHYATVTPESEAQLYDLLFVFGVDPDEYYAGYGCCLIAAIVMAGAPQVAALLRAGASTQVVAPDDFPVPHLVGATPLMLAAPKPEVVRLLIEHGCLPTEARDDGDSAIEVILAAATRAEDRARSTRDPWHLRFAERLGASRALVIQWVLDRMDQAEVALDADLSSED